MAKYRKKPIVIEAMQFNGVITEEFKDFMRDRMWGELFSPPWKCNSIGINTLEGYMEAHEGDWIVKGIQGEYYPVKNDIFEATYEKVEGV